MPRTAHQSATRLFTLAEPLGGVGSLLARPATLTHATLVADIRRQTGILNKLVRISVSLEADADLLGDLRQAPDIAQGV